MDVVWEYKNADNDKAIEKDEKYNGSEKGVQMSSKVYKRMRSVAVQTDRSVTVGTQTEEVDFLMMAEPLSDSLVVECSEDDDEDEDHDSLF